jgi:hypothetical protein
VEESKRAAIIELIAFAKTWCGASEVRSPKPDMSEQLREFVEKRFLDREWRRLMRVLAQVFPKNMWAEGIDYLERLRDWKEMRELLEKANHHFGFGLEPDDEEFIFNVDGQRLKLTRGDFKVIRPMTAKEKEHDEHERKEAQKEFEKKLKENYRAFSAEAEQVKTLRQVFAPLTST